MEVDLPIKEKDKRSVQYDEQGNAVPARVQPTKELLSIKLIPREPDKTTRIDSQQRPKLAGRSTPFLQENVDILHGQLMTSWALTLA
ncbi:UNVERIFIED_CONTAM: hypothetical protein Sradi_2363000 [Sesamum radiatum]|uniref:Uncharacterized protein n=1 Tax=Sesamum radiatum TaxID=300843 RepID=A0AAW2T6Q6_SESRA